MSREFNFTKDKYDMILGRYLISALGIDISIFMNDTVLGVAVLHKGCTLICLFLMVMTSDLVTRKFEKP